MKRIEFLRISLLTMLLGMFSFKLFSKEKETVTINPNPVIEFTPDELQKYNVGVYLILDRPNANVVEKPGYCCTIVSKIVYQHRQFHNTTNSKKDKEPVAKWNRYGLCAALVDGWTHWVGETHEEMCDYLNNNPHGNKYRILTPEELVYLINHKPNQKQLARYVK